MAKKVHLQYIGNVGLVRPSERFVIEVDREVYQTAKTNKRTLVGTVVQAEKNSPHPVGRFATTWTNPFDSMNEGGFPVFIKVNFG